MSNPTIDFLMSHRSIRRFEDRPLPDGVLETLIQCGQQASTSSNLQAYTVIHVADPERKKKLAELCADLFVRICIGIGWRIRCTGLIGLMGIMSRR